MSSRFNSPLTLLIGQFPEIDDPRLFAGLLPLYTAINQIQAGLTQFCGIAQQTSDTWGDLAASRTVYPQNHHRLYLPAGEAISYGYMVNLYNNAGVLNARNANATNNTKMCHGYCNEIGGSAGGGAYTEVIVLSGMVITSGLTPGTRYFLATTNGLITATAPVAAGNIEQVVGIALSATEFLFDTTLQWVQH